jgi:hypothetical protein
MRVLSAMREEGKIFVLYKKTLSLQNKNGIMIRTTTKIYALMMAAVFFCYYVSVTSFSHTHHYASGDVTHSHPYLPGGENPDTHHHSQAQSLTIAWLSALALIFIAFAVFRKITIAKRIYFPERKVSVCTHLISLQLRAPPLRLKAVERLVQGVALR